MVAIAFIENVDNLPQVNHKNGNRADNSADNLEWITNADNGKHGYRENKSRQTTKVKCLETGVVFDSVIQASEWLGTCHQNIFKVCNGERHTAGGYH